MFTFALDKKTHFVKTKSLTGRMPAKQIISNVLKAFPQITRAYTLAEFVTFSTDDAEIVSGIQSLANQLSAKPPMATYRLFVTSIGGLPTEAIKTIFAQAGEVEEVALVSPLGNPAAIVVLHSDTPVDNICKMHLPYSLTADGHVIESGVLGVQLAREKSTPNRPTKPKPQHGSSPSSRGKRARARPSCGPSVDLSGSLGSWHERGFTFIKSPSGDFFCHISGLDKSLFNAEGALHDSKAVAENTRVTFDVIEDPRDASRLRAVNVRLSSPPPLAEDPASVRVLQDPVNGDEGDPKTATLLHPPAPQSRRSSASALNDSKHKIGKEGAETHTRSRSTSPPRNSNSASSTSRSRSSRSRSRGGQSPARSREHSRERSPGRFRGSGGTRGAALQQAALNSQ